MTKMQIQYLGYLRCEATHLNSGNQIITDAPEDNHGKGEAFSPTDLLATSLATCMATVMGITATKQKIPLEDVKIEVEKVMANQPRRVSEIVITVKIKAKIDELQKEKLENAALNCPVTKSIHPDIHQNLTFKYVE